MRKTPFEPLSIIRGKPLIIDKANVDTDQIMPAQFLTTTTREDLGRYTFYALRYDKKNQILPGAYLNKATIADRRILVAGSNFGCGSSREHAPWGLYDYGVRVIIAESIAEIFKNNCLKNGIAAIEVSSETVSRVFSDPDKEITVDILRCTITAERTSPEGFVLDSMYRQCLITGQDQLSSLLSADDEIASFERVRGNS